MTPSDVIAEPTVTEISPEEMLLRMSAGRRLYVEQLERRNALLEGLTRRILDRITTSMEVYGSYHPVIGVELISKFRKELDELTKP